MRCSSLLELKSEPKTVRTFDQPGYTLVECTQQLGTSEVQTVPVNTSVMLPGQLFRDEKGEPTALFYVFDRYADKAVINATLAREFGFHALKNSKILLYQAFSLQDAKERIPEKRTEKTLLS